MDENDHPVALQIRRLENPSVDLHAVAGLHAHRLHQGKDSEMDGIEEIEIP